MIAGKYIAVYRFLKREDRVYVYHIAHGSKEYPVLFKRPLQEEETER